MRLVVTIIGRHFFSDFLLELDFGETKVSMQSLPRHTVLPGIYQLCALMLDSKTCLLYTVEAERVELH